MYDVVLEELRQPIWGVCKTKYCISPSQYLGSVIVVKVKGIQSTEEACLRLRVRLSHPPILPSLHTLIPHTPIPVPPQTSTENMQKLPDVILSVAWKGVKFIDGKSKVGCRGILYIIM